jgi:hypothetical protein
MTPAVPSASGGRASGRMVPSRSASADSAAASAPAASAQFGSAELTAEAIELLDELAAAIQSPMLADSRFLLSGTPTPSGARRPIWPSLSGGPARGSGEASLFPPANFRLQASQFDGEMFWPDDFFATASDFKLHLRPIEGERPGTLSATDIGRTQNCTLGCCALELVPPAGLEPARPCGQQILSLPRLPIPPRGRPIGSRVRRRRGQARPGQARGGRSSLPGPASP